MAVQEVVPEGWYHSVDAPALEIYWTGAEWDGQVRTTGAVDATAAGRIPPVGGWYIGDAMPAIELHWTGAQWSAEARPVDLDTTERTPAPPRPRPNSFGIASLVAAGCAIALLVPFYRGYWDFFMGGTGLALALVGVVFACIGLTRPGRRRVTAIIGLILNALTFLAGGVIYTVIILLAISFAYGHGG